MVINGEIAWVLAPTERALLSRIAAPFAPPVETSLSALVCLYFVKL
jgi:hypothetical protein